MQPRGRRRHGTFFAREYGLVVDAVLRVGSAAAGDIGRQRHVAALGQRRVERSAVEGEGERHFTALAFGLYRGVKLIEKAHPAFAAEAHDVADRKPLARFHQRVPARAVEALDQRCRDRRLAIASADTAAMETSRDHLGVVDDERVAGTQQVRQIAHGPVFERRRARMHHQQPRGIAR